MCLNRSFELHHGSGTLRPSDKLRGRIVWISPLDDAMGQVSTAPTPAPSLAVMSWRENVVTSPGCGDAGGPPWVQGGGATWLWDHDPPLCWISNCRCCQKLRKGAIPVPGPTRMQGTWGFRGRWKLGALSKEERVRGLAEPGVIRNSQVSGRPGGRLG